MMRLRDEQQTVNVVSSMVIDVTSHRRSFQRVPVIDHELNAMPIVKYEDKYISSDISESSKSIDTIELCYKLLLRK